MHHPNSCECTKTELDLFSIPPTQTSIDNGYWVDVHPAVSMTEEGPIEFSIAGGDHYMDLSNLQLYVKAKIKKNDGTNLADTDHPGPVNNWLHSIFEQVEVSLGDTIVSAATHTYPTELTLKPWPVWGRKPRKVN